jgi:hypothetical protein
VARRRSTGRKARLSTARRKQVDRRTGFTGLGDDPGTGNPWAVKQTEERGTSMSRIRLAALAAMLTCALTLGAVSTASAQTATKDFTKRVAVTGTAKNGKKFHGTYTIERFVKRNGQVYSSGTLRGWLNHRRVHRTGVRVPVTGFGGAGSAQTSQAACKVLTLTLGPLDLNLLGLRVQLNQLNLRITAIPGGGLLGDLLCSLTNALNPTGLTPAQLVAILNAFLALVPTTA